MTANKCHPVFPILCAMFFDQTCLSIIFPVLTFVFFDKHSRLFPMETSDAVRSQWYGFCIALPHLVNMIMTPCLSALSDSFGRKKIMMLAILGAFLMALLAGVSIILGLFSLFLIAVVIQGIFSRTDPIAIAAIGDISPSGKKVLLMGYVQTAISLGALLGPLLGGFFAARYFFSQLNFAMPFLIAAIFALVGFFTSAVFLKETLPQKETWLKKIDFKKIKNIFFQPQVLRITLILLLSQFSWRIYYQYIPPILKKEFAFSPHLLGLFVGMIAFWLCIATFFGIRFLKKFFTLEKMLTLSLYSVFLGILFTMFICVASMSVIWIWIAVIPIAMGDVIAFSCITAMYSDAVHKEEQGKIMGMCFIVVAMIWALTGFLGGMLMSVYVFLPLMIAPIGIVLAILLLHSNFLKKSLGVLESSV